MNNIQYKLEVERTNLLSIIVCLLLVIGGVALLFWSNDPKIWIGQEAFQVLVRDLGSLSIVSVAIAFIWELVAKRAFVDELLTKAQISQELSASGIVQFTYEPQPINWDDLFLNTHNVDVLFAYGKNWRGTHENKLNKIASNAGNRIRIVLPDPENEIVVKDLSIRVNKTVDGIRERILEARKDFSQLRVRNANSGAYIEIWYIAVSPTYTLFKFDKAVVMSLYSYLRIKGGVPHIVAMKGGSLYNSLSYEFESLLNENSGLCRRVE